jgi:tetratricopeptide (TPR) repeat protein
VAIAAVRDSLEKTEDKDDELSQEALSQAIKRAEDVLRSGLQRFPNDAHLLNEEASLSEILQNADRALRALQRAFDTNPRSELIGRRLGRVLRAKGGVQDAIVVLRRALDHNPGSQVLNYDLAQSIREQFPDADTVQGEALIYHFSRSFSPGDRNYEAQFWYARQLVLAGKGEEAQKFFLKLRQLQLPFTQKRSPRGIVMHQDRTPVVFYGQIYSRKPSFGFIRADQNGLEIYFYMNPNHEIADTLKVNQRVTYHLGFTLFGPLAFQVSPLLL